MLKNNVDLLLEKQDEFPHRCKTQIENPRPEKVKEKEQFSGNFIRVPLMPHFAVWGFTEKQDLNKFKQAYNKNLIE